MKYGCPKQLCWLLIGCLALSTNISGADKPGAKRLKYNHPGLTVDLGVGLWAWPMPVDYDADGDLDLLVSCPDVPYNGTWFFENPGDDPKLPTFRPGRRIGPVLRNVTHCIVDGQPRLLMPGTDVSAALAGDFETKHRIYPQTEVHGQSDARVRANQWSYTDYDNDGALDLIVGHGLWGDYGWDNAFNADGEWVRGPLHGYVYLLRNAATNDEPDYEPPAQLQAGDSAIDVFGMPSPNFADFDGDGDLDLICGSFIDDLTWFENTGSRAVPRFAAGRPLSHDGKPIEMHLCMIVVTSVDWDNDGDVDLIVGQEDGRVAFLEHTGQVTDHMPVFAEPRFFRQVADDVKFGALVTPVSFDWDDDGDEDLICGNTAGEIGFIENLDGGNPPRWAEPRLLEADGDVIRILAGRNGSIQGPAEEKWGYTTISVADWDHDQLPDIVVNSIWGRVVWYRNVGSRTEPGLTAAGPVKVDWPGVPPKPEWNWWNPASDELATQWRTTPVVVDWDKDGFNDLLMLDHEGYLALFRRERRGSELVLLPGERRFAGGTFDNIHRVRESDSALLRLNDGTAGKSGRRKLAVVDWTGDGLPDLLVNSENISLLEQTTTSDGITRFEDRGTLSRDKLAGHTTSPTTTDWDGDGTRELLIGAEDGYLYVLDESVAP